MDYKFHIMKFITLILYYWIVHMYAPVHKQIVWFFLSLLFLNVYTSKANHNSLRYYIAGTITVLLIAKFSYDYLQKYCITSEQIIEQAQSTFSTIQKDLHYHQKHYKNDVQISDWDLKDSILNSSKQPYPFLGYYKSIEKALLLLQQHYTTITNQLSTIQRYKNRSDHTNIILELETEGKKLKQKLSKMITLIETVKLKIVSFKEYHEDCYYWKEKMGSS